MPMSDGNNRLRKIAFQVGSKFFRFAINPENLSYSKPHRTTTVKTKSRIVVEDFQSDVPTVSIKGSTGFNPTGRTNDRGINKIKEMKKFIEEYAEMGGNGKTAAEDFYFHDFTNDESFVVHLSSEGITITQDVNSPLTHRYEMKLTILRKAGEPSDEDIVDPEIGNRFPSLPGGVGGVGGASSGLPNPYPIDPDWDFGYNDYDSDNGDVYEDNNRNNNKPYRPSINKEPVNPQAPSEMSYEYGKTGLGYTIGYYGRSY